MNQKARMPDMRRAHRDLVLGLRMAEIDHFVDRQKPSVERSWARAFWPHTHMLALKYPAAEGTERLRFRFDEQELASGAGLKRVRDAIVACKAQSFHGDAWLPSSRFWRSASPRRPPPRKCSDSESPWRRAEVDRTEVG